MQEISTIRELKAVVEGFGYYIIQNLNRRRIVCHPILPVVFLPEGIDLFPKEKLMPVKYYNTLLTSKDGQNWGTSYDDMIETVENGGDFFIADYKMNVFMSVEAYMLEEIMELLSGTINGIVALANFKWKPTEAGELSYFTIDEFLKLD